MGFFDQCIELSEKVEAELIKGKFCHAGLIIPFFLLNQSRAEIDYKPAKEETVVSIPHFQALLFLLWFL